MDKKAINEIRKLLKVDGQIDRIRCCYVSEKGERITDLQEAFSALEEETAERYCEVMKKTLTGKLGKSLFNVDFPLKEEEEGGKQAFLYDLAQSELNDEDLVQEAYERIMASFELDEKYLILLAHGTYDIPKKTKDNLELEDASDYVYSFILCSICPVKLVKEGLCYDADGQTFLDRSSDRAVSKPDIGFLFPAFNDREPDIHSALYFARREDERHQEFTDGFLGCSLPMPEADQKGLFTSMVEQTLGRDCDFENVRSLMGAVNQKITEEKDSGEPVQLSKEDMRRMLSENGADQKVLEDFDDAYEEAVGEDGTLMAENVADPSRLQVKSRDLTLNVKSDASAMLKTQVIDGVEYLLIPVVDDIEVNGIHILQSRREQG